MKKQLSADVQSLPYWSNEAKGILRAELDRRGVTYGKLAKMMQAHQMDVTERALANKISRGSFSFAFFLQVMRVLKVTHIALEPTEGVASLPYSGQPAPFEKG